MATKKRAAAAKTASADTKGGENKDEAIRAAVESAPKVTPPEEGGMGGGVTVPGSREGAQTSGELGGVRTPDPEKDIAILPTRTRLTGTETATGQALRDAQGENKVPQGEARGSTRAIDGGAPEPDLKVESGGEARGNQLEPAAFVSNGSVTLGMIGTPSGPQPAAAVATDVGAAVAREEQAAEERARLNQRFAQGRRIFTPEEVGRMGRAELVAISGQYGYGTDLDRGTRVTRSSFLAAQEKAQRDAGSEEE